MKRLIDKKEGRQKVGARGCGTDNNAGRFGGKIKDRKSYSHGEARV